MTEPIPIWLRSIEPDSSTLQMNNSIVQCSLRYPKTWDPHPEMESNDVEIEHVFHGKDRSEWLVIHYIENADPTAHLPDWLDMIIAVTGFPSLPIARTCESKPIVREWEPLGSPAPLLEGLMLDELYGYHGLAELGEPNRLARVYSLLARRGTCAWKVILSLPSTGTDGTLMGDYQQAAVILGNLRFKVNDHE